MGAAIALAATPAWAQPTLGTPVEAAGPIALPPEKQAVIREHAARTTNLPNAELPEAVRIGMVIPNEVELLSLPQDAATATPAVTSYSYIIAGDVIAVVDPANRTVIQLIKR
jgi:hypothetical protein